MTPEIKVNVQETYVPDPSGGTGQVKLVQMTPVGFQTSGPESDLIIDVADGEDLTLTFQLIGAPDGSVFTAFRYYNCSDKYWNKGWWHPNGSGDPVGSEGQEFRCLHRDGQTMTVVDRSEHGALYLYVVEWTEPNSSDPSMPHRYVCEPKIKNEPPPLLGRKEKK